MWWGGGCTARTELASMRAEGQENGSRCFRATGEVISALEVELDGEAPATHL